MKGKGKKRWGEKARQGSRAEQMPKITNEAEQGGLLIAAGGGGKRREIRSG